MARILKTPAPLPLWTYKAFLLVAAAIWGLGTVVIKSTVDAFPPAWIVGVRFTAAGIILGVVMLPRIRKHLDAEHLCKGSVSVVMTRHPDLIQICNMFCYQHIFCILMKDG